jgi:hypothetical protein
MKKIYSLIMAFAIALTANSQLVINENFTGYTNPLNSQNGWVQNGTGNDVQINTFNPLTRAGYTSGGHYMSVASVNGTDPHKPFSGAGSVSTTSDQTFFMSFLVRVTYASQFNGQPQYSISLANTTNGTFPARFYVGEENGASTAIEFGIAVGSSNPSYTNLDLVYGTTYLVVIRYDVVTTGNDVAYLWVDPVLTSEPTIASANATQSGGELAYGSFLNALKVTQSDDDASPDADYDGFRVAAGATSALAWSTLSPVGAPLPVQLTSFNASEETFGTKLVWNTAEESGIVSYVVERSTDGRNFAEIGTVKAANLRSYSFTDAHPAADNNYYRLKMVEMDGTFKYSFIISLKAKLTTNISVSPNPVKNFVMIQHPKAGAAGHIQIISATGQMIRDIRLSANAVISNVDMSGFTSGLYHIVFKNGGEIFNKTILKQ